MKLLYNYIMIYLDYAAATPVSEKVKEAMVPYFSEYFFNPSSPYLPAQKVREEYENAKAKLAHVIGAKGADLVITSGATESINLAFTAINDKRVLYLETEHAAVRETAKKYRHDVVKVDKNGMIDLEDLAAKITDDTTLVSVALVNNELGTIQPLAKISEIIKKVREERLKSHNPVPLYLHSDASQALPLIDISVARMGVDFLTLNAAKVYGPKGIGALYVAHGAKLSPITTGGGQEMGLRSGTENVPSLIGFAVAAKEAKDHINGNRKKYQVLKNILKQELKKSKIEPVFFGNEKHQLSSFLPVSFPGLDAERLIYKLEDKEVYLSTGAACAASKGEKSHVLTAINRTDEEIAGSLRISMGEQNNEENIKEAGRLIVQAVNEEWERIHG